MSSIHLSEMVLFISTAIVILKVVSDVYEDAIVGGVHDFFKSIKDMFENFIWWIRETEIKR